VGSAKPKMCRCGESITIWDNYVQAMHDILYTLMYREDRYMKWQTLCQRHDQIVDDHMDEFHMLVTHLNIEEEETNIVLEYWHGLHQYHYD
jgi:hypothetical protein